MKRLRDKSMNRCAVSFLQGTIIPGIVLLVSSVFLGAPSLLPQELPLPSMDYRIGTRDLLEITVLETPEINKTVRVSEDGSIDLFLIGRVEVEGLTTQELERKLAEILNKVFTKDAHVTVVVREFQKAAVLGAVGRPGEYELVGPTRLLEMIAKAGGPTATATNDLFIIRQEKDGRQTRISIKLDDLTVSGKQESNILILPKDVITIPIEQTLTVFVYGEVQTPGVISFLGSKKLTVLQAVTQAGSLTEWASPRRIKILRKDKKTGKEIKIPVNLVLIMKGKAPNILLEEGDVVIVP